MRLSWSERVAVLALVLGTLVVLGWATPAALADPVPTWTTACGDPNNLDVAVCERLTYIAGEQERIDAQLTADAADRSTGTYAERLDLIWSGVWFVGGTAFGIWAFRGLAREAFRWEGA